MRLSGKRAIVTGAGRGIGLATALALLKEGVLVGGMSATQKSADALQRAADELSLGGSCYSVVADVSDETQANDVVREALKKFDGRLDILVNNAGITRDGPLRRMPLDNFKRVVDVNLTGPFLLIKATAQAMMKTAKDNGFGFASIVNISSIAGIYGNAYQANYAASKAGLIGLTKTVAQEFAGSGITCNAVAPGFTRTDMTTPLFAKPGAEDEWKKKIPLGRIIEPEEVAALVVHLCLPGSRSITGQVIEIAGGLRI